MKSSYSALAAAAVLLTLPVAVFAQTVETRGAGFFNDSRSCSDNAFNYWQTNYFDKNISAAAVTTYCGCNLTIAQQQPTCDIEGAAANGGKYAWKFDIQITPLGNNSPSGSGPIQTGGSNTDIQVGGQNTGGPIQGGGANNGGGGISLINPLKATNLQQFVADIISIVVRIGTIVVVLMLVYVGYLFATTSINPENKNKAREALLWTLVGALILLGAQAIAVGIQATVNALS
jgi:hypothetical protein